MKETILMRRFTRRRAMEEGCSTKAGCGTTCGAFRSSWPQRRWAAFSAVTGLIVALQIAVASPEAVAQVPPDQRESVVAAIEAARTDLDPSRIPDLDAARADLQRAYDRLVQYLNATADAANRDAWLRYINFDPLQEAIAEDAPVARQGRLAQDLYWRLVRNQPGIEREPVVVFREVVERFIDAALFRDHERTVEIIDRQLEQIADLLRESEGAFDVDETARINRSLRFISASRLAPQVVDRLRSLLNQPNVRVLAGRRMVTELINRPVVRSTPSDECILGVRIIGQAHLQGAVTADLLPSEGDARLRLTLAAQFSNRGTGYARPVRLQTLGYGHVTASRVLQIGNRGVAAGPVFADAAVGSELLGVDHHLRIVRRIAARRAAEQSPQANRIAAGRLRDRVAGEFAEETNQRLADGNLLPGALAGDTLRRLALDPPERRWASSFDYLQLGLTVRGEHQTSTALAPPSPPGGHELVVQIQESAIDNAASQVLADRTLVDSQLALFIGNLLPNGGLGQIESMSAAEAANGALEALTRDPLKIHFAALRPIIFEAEEGKLRIGIRGTRFEQGDRLLDQALEITALYQPDRLADGTAALVRDGDVRVSFPGGRARRLTIQQIALRQAIEEKFQAVFPERLLDQPLEMPSEEPTRTRGTRRMLRAQQITAEQGWLTIALAQQNAGSPRVAAAPSRSNM